ncbi:hypothetical protein [Rhodoglobus sp.]
MPTLTPSYGFTPMSEADVLAEYGPCLRMARLFEYCDKQASRTEKIGAYSFFLLHYISDAEVQVIEGEFVASDDVAEKWSDEDYATAVHNANYCMNEEYAKGSLHPWLVKACEASRGWNWHTHTHRVQTRPTVRAILAAEIRKYTRLLSRR